MKPICTKAAATFLSAAAFLFACCSKPSSAEETVKDKIAFRQNELMLFVGEEAAVPVTYQIFDRGVYVDAEYDFKADPLGVIIGSSDPDVATVSGGKVRGKAKGTCTLTLSSDKVKAGGQLVVTVKENEVTPGAKFNQDITQPLTADMIALPLGLQTGMQSFDIDKRGRFYM